jgi:hypothetical protein
VTGRQARPAAQPPPTRGAPHGAAAPPTARPATARPATARWAADLAIGARFAFTGGRESWLRTVLTAVGVGLGVALLLLASAVPNINAARHSREYARAVPTQSAKPGPRTVDVSEVGTSYHGHGIGGVLVAPDGDHPPVPPGLSRLPGRGEMAVSPALKKLLDSDGGRLLRQRLPYRTVATIGRAGLMDSGEYRYYAGAGHGVLTGHDEHIDRWGYDSRTEPLDPVLMTLVVLGCVMLLMPVAVFIATAVRFGGERRDRRLAALRLVGADTRMTRRIAAGEALAGALVGLAVGAGVFLAVRRLAGTVTLWGVGAYPGDVRPSVPLTLLVAVAVPVCAVAVALLALRGVAIEPLGVVRRGTPRRRRLGWRLAVPAVGLLMLLPVTITGRTTLGLWNTGQIVLGAILVLVGVTGLLPWVVENVVGRLHGGAVSWELAMGRLRMSSDTASRAVSGITVAVAGAIALQSFFAGIQSGYVTSTRQDPHRAQLEATFPARDGRTADHLIDRFRATRGVQAVLGTVEAPIGRPGPLRKGEEYVPETGITVGDCATLRELARIGHCTDGDVFVVRGSSAHDDAAAVARPGARVDLHPAGDGRPSGRPLLWTIPASARAVASRTDPAGTEHSGVLATPSAVRVSSLHDAEARVLLRLDPRQRDATEYVRDTAARVSPLTFVSTLSATDESNRFATVRKGIFIGATATLALIAASMLVTTIEQLRDRRRLLSVLVAFGTRRTTLGLSVLWQTAVPVALGLALSVTGGLGLGLILLHMVSRPMTTWWAFLPMAALGAGLVLTVTLISLPPLWRMMRPDGLRTE